MRMKLCLLIVVCSLFGCALDTSGTAMPFGDAAGASGGGGSSVSTGGASSASGTGGASVSTGGTGAGGTGVAGAGPSGTGGAFASTGGAGVVVPTCTSGRMWSPSTGHSDGTMAPGTTCNSCHAFTVAGTLYPTPTENDNCNGADGTAANLQILITDSTGFVLTLPVNAAGNFYSTVTLVPPLAVKTYESGATKAMRARPLGGDCNSCHDASARITP